MTDWRSPYPADAPGLVPYDEEPETEPAIKLDDLLHAIADQNRADDAATFRLAGVPFKTTTAPQIGGVYRIDGADWLCFTKNESRAGLHPIGQPSRTISVSAEAELREVPNG